MKEYLRSFIREYSYPDDAQKQILSDYEKVYNNPAFSCLVGSFYKGKDKEAAEFQRCLDEIGKEINVNRYTLYLIFFVCLSKQLREEYEEACLDDEIYRETVEDLRCKLMECHETDKVWGVIPFGWYNNMFRMKTYALGRLEYNLGRFGENETVVAGCKVNSEDTVVYIHIPSSGKPFDRETRLASYEKAYHFFKDKFHDNTPIFCCDTWLLNPENKTVLGEGSNISSFIDDFKIIKKYEYPDNRNMWRIFGADGDQPPSRLPRKTSLQRKIADWLQSGGKLGGGKGIFVYDPINKTTLK